METDKKIKLSAAQQKVIDILRSNDTYYIYHSNYYDFQKIVSPEMIPSEYDPTIKSHHVHYFKLPTFNVLLRNGLIKESNTQKQFILTNPNK